jgi:hypothetical protein
MAFDFNTRHMRSERCRTCLQGTKTPHRIVREPLQTRSARNR